MHRRLFTLLALSSLIGGAEVVDRVAVIVGRHVVKTSDIERDLRVSNFLNHQPLDESADARHTAAERLIDQELVRAELLNGQYSAPTEQDVVTFLQQLKRERFGGSDARFQTDLARYHLTEDQLKRQLLWQLTVLRFIDQRFRPAVLVTDEDVAAYYREHRADLQKASPRNDSLEALTPKIQEMLTGERINQAFDEWLAETRRATRIEYRQKAFGGGTSQ